MAEDFRVRELVLGIEGLALLRTAVDADDAFVEARLAEIRKFADGAGDAGLPGEGASVAELDAAAGYASWAARYDSLPSSFLEVEEPIVHRLLDEGPVGTALDAACGTGRTTVALTARGYRAIGVDQSPEMLAHARRKAPDAEFREGRLERLPVDDASVDLAISTLALTHLPDPGPGIAELARVVRPGGRVIVTDLHPFVIALQGQCLFVHGEDRLAFVRNHVHLPGRYIEAFTSAGLSVRACHEPVFNGRLAPGGYEEFIADAARAAWEGIPIVIVWEAVKL
ncbi:class I SAM-dependent methyltransferase [Streptomyces clavuligerus]|uniref:class I SAM-dependent methyltransferase n=1 Tax=Streptomyces clavuligerus TaxID=1901 RepID=UPI00081098E7|nr:class I SAM-dependent methyltransferase [Streptomyces clavuligerus]ANW17087.1 methyltransferase type 11 [Streptomyces clavuligerus]AXU11624.1 class I SAM-dependent methyltransferase [Streptomyces clavuligerus]MBY6301457.1 class I SAM-dependent methyltransferase [Streptomyces clavuligerus]QPL61745.1 class I SAM-dependent methyltransferase [Streptomyces clavuligerus]QPL67778.1 class I SAM-dependent methyltransferase [Streptomyces clavuligerus]